MTESPASQIGTERAAPVEVRRLLYTDLPQVIAIERRVFPTPWSLAMFVLELSKPTGICLAAMCEETLLGYLICSRYDTVWHLMNLAIRPDRQRMGIATALLAELYERVRAILEEEDEIAAVRETYPLVSKALDSGDLEHSHRRAHKPP